MPLHVSRPLLLEYAARPCKAPGGPILRCPPALVQELAENNLEVQDTCTDGNCGLDAFAIGFSLLGRRHASVRNRAAFRNFQKAYSAGSHTKHLRETAVAWMTAHAELKVWANMSFRELALSMASSTGSYKDYLARMGQDGQWADAAVLHALACHHGVDVAALESLLTTLAYSSAVVAPRLCPFHSALRECVVSQLHGWTKTVSGPMLLYCTRWLAITGSK
jgi:hypothetical protein